MMCINTWTKVGACARNGGQARWSPKNRDASGAERRGAQASRERVWAERLSSTMCTVGIQSSKTVLDWLKSNGNDGCTATPRVCVASLHASRHGSTLGPAWPTAPRYCPDGWRWGVLFCLFRASSGRRSYLVAAAAVRMGGSRRAASPQALARSSRRARIR